MARHVLNAEQQAAVDAIVQPRGARLIVVEGGPGQGKTTVIEESIRMLRIPVAVLASCACAAVRVNVIDPNARGMTISMFTKIWNGFQRGIMLIRCGSVSLRRLSTTACRNWRSWR